MNTRVLSVIIPARNASRTLPTLLSALLDFDTPSGWDKEIIVSYTESDDDTLQVIEDMPVKSVICETIGPAAARNSAARLATGDFLYFIDADACPIGSDFFTRLISTALQLEKHGELGGFGGPILLEPSQQRNPVAQADHFACWFNWSSHRRDEETRLFQPTVSLVMPRAAFEKLGGFDERFRVLEDFELQQRALGLGLRFYFSTEVGVTHWARNTLFKSWRHSWYWGAPFRSAYLAQTVDQTTLISAESIWFWLRLPTVFLRRMRLVLRSAWKESRRRTLLTLPFTAATVFAWSLAVVLGRGQPSTNKPHAA